jgi:hypothetical protein
LYYRRQAVLKKGDNVVIPIPAADRGPTDPRNIKGVVTQVNDHGGYNVGTDNARLQARTIFELVISEKKSTS